MATQFMKDQVMIVDDDTSIAICVDKVLTAAGYGVVKSVNGAECLKALRAGFRGLMLMDIMMPKMDGWATIRAAVNEGLQEGNLICMLTAIDDPGGAGEGLQEYVYNYLPKPFENEELLAMVRDAFECFEAGAAVESSGGREGEH